MDGDGLSKSELRIGNLLFQEIIVRREFADSLQVGSCSQDKTLILTLKTLI